MHPRFFTRLDLFFRVDFEESSEVRSSGGRPYESGVVFANVEPVMGAEPSETVRGRDTPAVFVGRCVRNERGVHVSDTNGVAMRITDRPEAVVPL